jgi:periplasmic protein TonB
MMPLTKWCGFSFVLHLLFASAVFWAASREVGLPHKVVAVTLDFIATPDFPLPKESRDQVKATVRTTPPARKPRPAPAARGAADPSADTHRPPVPERSSPEPAQTGHLQHRLPGNTDQTSEMRESGQVQTGAPASRSSAAGQPAHPERAAAEQRPAPESAKQRYLVENYAYIRDVIAKKLVYPPMARKMNWSGKAVVSFTIVEDGSVHSLRMVQSSGYPVLDSSALETVRQAAPFPKPPARAEIVVPINFKMQ